MNARRWTRVLWGSTAFVVLLLLLKFFVADVYRVDSGSMRPTLFGGRNRADGTEDAEHVLVLYERGFRPERFDLVVIRSTDGSKPLVKRVCGLPKERILIRDGDLLFDGQRLPPDAPRPEPVTVYDDRYLAAERFFEYRPDGSVRRDGSEWVVEGGTVPPGSMLLYHPDLLDDYLDRQHQRVPGLVEVNDAILELEFELEAPLASQRLRFRLIEAGDTFEVVLDAGSGAGTLRLVRRTPSTLQEGRDPITGAPPQRERHLAEAPVALAAGRWYHLEFSNVDNHLLVRCPELGVELRHSYEDNEPWPAALPAGRRTIGPRVGFGAEAGCARFRSVRILRDLFYTQDGKFGTEALERGDEGAHRGTISLGLDEYFLLGDNSAASTDSRHFGAKKGSELIGRPLAVVWPEPRWLHSVAKARP